MKATQKQTGYLWGFSIRYRADGTSIKWNALANAGDLSKNQAISLIRLCKGWEADRSAGKQKELFDALRSYDPAFTFKTDCPAPAPVPDDEDDAPAAAAASDHDILKTLEVILKPTLYADLIAYIEQNSGSGVKVIPMQDGDYLKPEIFDTAYAELAAGNNLLIYGPAGCGKTRMVAEIAKAAGKPFTNISMSGGVRYSQVFGGPQMVIEDGQQVTKFVPAALLVAIQQAGVVNVDEIMAADPDVLLGLNSLLETDSRCIMTPMGMVYVHPDCWITACSNTNGRSISAQFTGAQRADDSLNDRFTAMSMTYSDAVEDKILDRIQDGPAKSYVRNNLRQLREKVRMNNITFDPSTRRLLTCLRSLSGGVPVEIAFANAFLNHLSVAERGKVGL